VRSAWKFDSGGTLFHGLLATLNSAKDLFERRPILRQPVHATKCSSATGDRKRPPPGAVNMWDEYSKWKRANPVAHATALRGGLIGSPETIRRKLKKFQSSNIDQVVLLNQAGKNTHEHICESLERHRAEPFGR
jgi:hypothetical protein